MRLLRAILLFLLASPTSAWAADVTLRARDVPVGRTVMAPLEFETVGVHWRGPGRVELRTRSVAGRWSSWRPAQPEPEDVPDFDSTENRRRSWRIGNPWRVGASSALQVRAHGRVTAVRAFFVHAPAYRIPLRRLSIAGSPPILTRAAWGANESLRRAPPRYAESLEFALVHHTAGAAGATPAEAAAIVRGILAYHVQGNGWDDIGYNFLVDRFGNVYEGRYGGVDRNVIGAHAEGFNNGSVGVSMIGTFSKTAPPPAQLQALEKVLAWRLDLAHIDPFSTVSVMSRGNSKFPTGQMVSLRAVSAHRDTGPTTCPGDAAYAKLGEIARQIAALGAPKLYAPRTSGTLGGPVRFTGRLSSSLVWTVTVRDIDGRILAAGTGTGTSIDWTWDSRGARPGASYLWEMAAGADVRPASGTLGAKLAALAVTGVVATPPRLDGTTVTSSTISYTLSVPASVTADLLNAAGTAVATLFVEDKPAGKQSFVFTPEGVPDGSYRIRLTARDAGGRHASASIALLISRTLLGFAVDIPAVSPNGDGRRDAAKFSVALVAPADVAISLVAGKKSIPLLQATLPEGEHVLPWAGRAADGARIPDGHYRATVVVGTPPLSISHSVPLVVDTRPPRLRLVWLAPPRLNVTEEATIIGVVNGRGLRIATKAGVVRIPVKTLRTLRVIARDPAANESALLRYPRS